MELLHQFDLVIRGVYVTKSRSNPLGFRLNKMISE